MVVAPEGPLERAIMADPRWIAGAAWGWPRPGHPEGQVGAHIVEVLAILEKQRLDDDDKQKLRLIALLHDSFKAEVDRTRPRSGENHHGLIARRFAERYVNDPDVLEIVELHDEAYNSWVVGNRRGKWVDAEARAFRLVERLGPRLSLYLAFYRADNAAGDKRSEPLLWFEDLVAHRRGTA
jgi:hypothetical protein